jgi:multidrug efflux pump subunit AcrB
MAVEVTRPMEEALRTIPGVRNVQSKSSRGSSEVWLTFDWGQDMLGATLQADALANKLLPTLPTGTTAEVRQMDPTLFSTISYSLTSDSRSLNEIRDLAQFQLRPLLASVPGVSRIDVKGGAVEEYRVTVDPAKLASLAIGIQDVAAALTAANVQNAVGQLEDRYKLYLVVADMRFRNIDELGSTVLRSGTSGIVRLSDVATIHRDASPQFTLATADGKNAVLLDVYQQPGANTIDIARKISVALDAEQARHPDVRMTKWYDQSDLITASARSVRESVLIGVILAAVVLLLFLRNWRITLVAALTVPVVLTITALLLRLLGQSFNIMTLGGMAAAVGLIIDDAIVMCEHIVRRAHARVGVLEAADEFRKPLIGSSLSTIVIHIPPAFMIGVAGAFFAALSLSMASSLVVSFLVAWLVIPVLAARFLRGRQIEKLEHEPPATHRIYPAMMRSVLAMPWLGALIAVPILLAVTCASIACRRSSCLRRTKADSSSTTARGPARPLPRRT